MSSDSPFQWDEEPSPFAWDEDPTPPKFTVEPDDPFAQEEPQVIEGETVEDNTPVKIDPEEFQTYVTLTVLQKIINNAIADYTGERKKAMDKKLPEASRQLGTDQWKVRVPTIDGGDIHIGTVSVKRTKESTDVVSQIDFIEWAEKNYPGIVEVEHTPAKTVQVEAKTVKRVKASMLQDLIDAKKAVPDGDGGLVTSDGEVIPGLKHTEKDQYNGHMISFGGKNSPLEQAGLQALLGNRLKGQTMNDIIQRTAIEKGTK